MNFTREPIIETVITPREGSKLVVRNSKGNGQEEYLVDAIEVVSFGQSLFFRSEERPKSFLVPIGDYEVIEMKETRMPLKNAPMERAIKIGGGKDMSRHPTKESSSEETIPPIEQKKPPENIDRAPKRDGRRRRGRRGGHHEARSQEIIKDGAGLELAGEEPVSAPAEGVVKPPSFISKLFPPPSTLIKETIGRYKLPEAPLQEDISMSLEKETREEIIETEFPNLPSEEKQSEDENDEN